MVPIYLWMTKECLASQVAVNRVILKDHLIHTQNENEVSGKNERRCSRVLTGVPVMLDQAIPLSVLL